MDHHNLLPHGTHVVVGLSGGPDSVFLLYLLHSLRKIRNLILHAAHLNHEWRPDSDKDELFCRELSKKLDISFTSSRISELSALPKYNGSKEALGRSARRYFLESVRKEHNADIITLAHHAQDQQETFFIRLLRGSSLTGLTAMRPKTGLYIRPLLETNKSDIINYLKQNNISFLTDPSNTSPVFLRNRIRATVIPALKECDTRFDTTFTATLHRLQETEDYLKQQTKNLFSHITELRNSTLWLSLHLFRKEHPIMQTRLLLHWMCKEKVTFPPTHAFLQELIRFLNKQKGGTHQVHETWNLIKKQQWACIKKI